MTIAQEHKERQRQKRALRCRHFKAIATFDTGQIVRNSTCEVGIAYDSVRVGSDLPCFGRGTCAKFEGYTAAELEAEETRWRDGARKTLEARAAIVASKLKSGAIECPCCKVAGALHFNVSPYNGHIHAKCATGCVAWIE